MGAWPITVKSQGMVRYLDLINYLFSRGLELHVLSATLIGSFWIFVLELTHPLLMIFALVSYSLTWFYLYVVIQMGLLFPVW